MSHIVIFGSGGYMGSHFSKKYPQAVCPKVDIADRGAVCNVLDTENPDIIINCAGKTGRPNVDWCEDHKMETVHSNVMGPLVLLEEAQNRNVYFVHIGTGCIYSGSADTEFSETDRPNFFGSFYSRTKGYIDQILQEFDVLNIRLRMPFDGSKEDRNLINKLRKYDRVLDVVNSMTYIPDLLTAVDALLSSSVTGTFNVVNSNPVSPYHVMELYQEIIDPNHQFGRLSLEDLPSVTKAGRSNCVLSGKKLEDAGVAMKSTEDALKEALEMLKSEA